MSEPQPAGSSQTAPLNDAEREARIEQLLLAGLDHYFSGQYDQAITVWTRVAFLERGHGRARAYIERARRALAERQREGDELLHAGIAAYEAGDWSAARDLLTRTLDHGGPAETALLFLQRLNRVESAAGEAPAGPSVPGARHRAPQPAAGRPRSGWLATAVASAAVAVGVLLAALQVASWLAELPVGAPAPEAPRVETLPVVTPADLVIERARALAAERRWQDALRVLGDIDDAERADARRLRAELQERLLGTILPDGSP